MVDVPELDVWRAEVREWLTRTLPRRDQEEERERERVYAIFHNLTDEEERELLARARAYRAARYDAGYGALTLAAEYGGSGLPGEFALAFTAEEQAFAVPPSNELISVTTGLAGPTVAMFGTPDQRARWAHRFLRTDLLCCQLFTEPGAGSDLAAVATRATRDGDAWVLDGQKVWSSGARFADYGLLLARTDPTVPKHAGLTVFLVPMNAPGVEVRPIRQMSGGSSFNEVFLTGCRVTDDHRIGEEGEGWRVATTTLRFERTASGQVQRRKGGSFEDVLALARRVGRTDDPVIRQRLADLYIRLRLREATAERVARATASGRSPGPAASIGKLVASENLTRIGDLARELLGGRLVADNGEPDTFAWSEHLLGAPGYRLAGGTDEIQHDIIGERVLGLPKEPRVDIDIPFAELRHG